MPVSTIDPAHQAFILARIGEFCQYKERVRDWERDPWIYMRDKLVQIEPSLAALKGQLLAATSRHLLDAMRAGPLEPEAAADFKQLLERLLTRGDFADVAVHLDGAGPQAVRWVEPLLARAKPTHAFLEERRPAAERDPSWEKLVKELYARLDLDRLGAVLQKRKRTPRRRALVLRRLRRNVAEYCLVVRIPTQANDTFTPFMMPRVEAVIAACLRFLSRHR
jgi:hypothetical protein